MTNKLPKKITISEYLSPSTHPGTLLVWPPDSDFESKGRGRSHTWCNHTWRIVAVAGWSCSASLPRMYVSTGSGEVVCERKSTLAEWGDKESTSRRQQERKTSKNFRDSAWKIPGDTCSWHFAKMRKSSCISSTVIYSHFLVTWFYVL